MCTVIVTDEGPLLRAAVTLPGCAPDRALAAFTDPAVLPRWWGGELITTLAPGGAYTISFRQLDRAITGQVVSYAAADHLQFSWSWDHQPEAVPRTVLVTVRPGAEPDETELTVVHGPHGDDAAERQARTEHREGWEYFLPRLAALLGAGS